MLQSYRTLRIWVTWSVFCVFVFDSGKCMLLWHVISVSQHRGGLASVWEVRFCWMQEWEGMSRGLQWRSEMHDVFPSAVTHQIPRTTDYSLSLSLLGNWPILTHQNMLRWSHKLHINEKHHLTERDIVKQVICSQCCVEFWPLFLVLSIFPTAPRKGQRT